MKKPQILLTCCALSLFALTVQARNTKILMPLVEVMQSAKTKAVIGEDIKLYFGDKSPEGAQSIGEFYSRGEAKPYKTTASGRTRPLDDETTCRAAMRIALADLVQQAHARDGNALVDISSFYNRVEMRSNEVYECHAGMTRAVVDLKGRLVRIEPAKQGD